MSGLSHKTKEQKQLKMQKGPVSNNLIELEENKSIILYK